MAKTPRTGSAITIRTTSTNGPSKTGSPASQTVAAQRRPKPSGGDQLTLTLRGYGRLRQFLGAGLLPNAGHRRSAKRVGLKGLPVDAIKTARIGGDSVKARDVTRLPAVTGDLRGPSWRC